jgi:hypothetical protein
MLKRHIKLFAKDFKELEHCDKVIGYEASVSAFELPFEIDPTEGEHDYTKCDQCLHALQQITGFLKAKFDGNEKQKGFPYCCPNHTNLIKLKDFNRDSFVNVPEMVARKIVYTKQHIINNYNSDNWYKKIIDYIQWMEESFGQMPNDCGPRLFLWDYFYYLTQMVKWIKEIPIEKKGRILEYLEPQNSNNQSDNTNLSILLSTYNRWLKIFPLELNIYFAELKKDLESQLPILNGRPEQNLYSGHVSFKVHTYTSMIESLVQLTNRILTKISGLVLLENGLVTDSEKMQVDLIIQERKQQLKQGYKNESPKENHRYKKMIQAWLKHEREFWMKLTPVFNKAKQSLKAKPETVQSIPKTFEELFHNSQNAEPCLSILRELNPPVIDSQNSYIGKNKGVFPLWVKVLKNHIPSPIIKHCKDYVYKDLLNSKVKGLKLTKDASEFRKTYKRLDSDKTELEIKTILSQFSQSGRLGK